MAPVNALIVVTSHSKMGLTEMETGVWLEELATPYYIFKDAGITVTVASPLGGEIPLDPKSRSLIMATRNTKRFNNDDDSPTLLANAVALETINANEYDLVFIAGGHGAMWDLADNTYLKKIIENLNARSKPIGAVCHGVAGLLTMENLTGDTLIKGKKITGFSNSEEESAGLTKIVPFLLETNLVAAGALYSSAVNYTSYVVTDGNIITGQNPASSEEVAKQIMAYCSPAAIRVVQPVY
jgi:putative intracellular protease/amidase